MFDLIEARSAGVATILAAVVILLAAGLAIATPLTFSEEETCAPEALRFCAGSVALHDSKKIGACMIAHRSALSAACGAVVDRHTVPSVPGKHAVRRHPSHATAVPAARPAAAPAPPPVPSVLPPPPPSAKPEPPAEVHPAPPAPPKTERHRSMLTLVHDFFVAWSPLILLGVLALYIVKNGLPSVLAFFSRMWGYVSSLWNAGVADVKAAQTALANDVAAVKTDVSNIAGHLVSTGALPATLAPAASTSSAVAAVAAAAKPAKTA